ncbi:Multisubstrate pseudouridine synthase 7 [Exophiala dermatitidis]
MDRSSELRPSKRARLDDAPNDRTGGTDHTISDPAIGQGEVGTSNMTACLPGDEDGREIEVGITTFVGGARGKFHGILKKRYTDFMVNEILPNGRVLHLQSLSAKAAGTSGMASNQGTRSNGQSEAQEQDCVPSHKDDKPIVETSEKVAESAGVSDNKSAEERPEVSEDDRAKLVEYFNEEAVQQLLALYTSILKDPKKKSSEHETVRTSFTTDRSVRSQIHQDIRRIFYGKIDSSTDKDGTLVLRAVGLNNRNRGWGKPDGKGKARPGKLGWLDRGGEYLHFTLYKENKDTLEAVSFISNQLKTTNKTFQFAGTKDRRAVTVQRVSAYRIEAPRLAGLNRILRFSAVGDFEYQKHGLELGDLSGNEFVVTLRDCSIEGAESAATTSDRVSLARSYLGQSLQGLREKGFLNYYGLQRFGTFATRTDAVGVKILQGDYEGACNGILQFSPVALDAANAGDSDTMVGQDDRARAEGINIWRTTGNVNEALDRIPRKFSAERALIRELGRQPQNFLGALSAIQRNLRLMYVHAYQSLVWNLAVSERWRLYGDTVVEGDLVLVQEHKDKEATVEVEPTVDADGEVVIQPAQDDRAKDPDDIYERARALTAEEAASGQYSIFDVVLPLPGFDVIYPANASGEWYKTFMGSEAGGRLDPHDMRRKQRDFSLSGGYRKILARIGADYDLQVHEYRNDSEQFVQTDLERIKAERGAKQKDGGETGQGQEQDQDQGQDQTSTLPTDTSDVEPKLAAVLKFQLGASQYATVAMRELSRGGIRAYKPEFMGGR